MDIHLKSVSDVRLLEGLKRHLTRERRLLAKFLAYLAEVDSRKLYAQQGYPSLFAYCCEVLKLSESSALKRISAARLAQRYSQIYALLESGEISLAVLSRLSPHLQSCSGWSLLEECKGMSVRQTERHLAGRFPKPEEPDRIQDFAEARVRISFNADRALAVRIKRAQDLLGHKYPEGKLEQVISDAMDALLEKLAVPDEKDELPPPNIPSRFFHTMLSGKDLHERIPLREAATQDDPRYSRYIPRGIQRAIWERDRGCCTFVSAGGKRCGARRFLEIDHIVPWVQGGEPTIENLRLLCRTHNLWMAKTHKVGGWPARAHSSA